MRADKEFRAYEQALTIVQRLGEQAEADHKKGKHREAQDNLSLGIFVGIKHLLFMAADAAIERAQARELAAKNHLVTVELLSLTLAESRNSGAANGNKERMPTAKNSKGRRHSRDADGQASKVTNRTIGDAASRAKMNPKAAGPSRKSGLRKDRP